MKNIVIFFKKKKKNIVEVSKIIPLLFFSSASCDVLIIKIKLISLLSPHQNDEIKSNCKYYVWSVKPWEN